MAPNLTWDYTDLAEHYDKRADYGEKAIDRLLQCSGIGVGSAVADTVPGPESLHSRSPATLMTDGVRIYGVRLRFEGRLADLKVGGKS